MMEQVVGYCIAWPQKVNCYRLTEDKFVTVNKGMCQVLTTGFVIIIQITVVWFLKISAVITCTCNGFQVKHDSSKTGAGGSPCWLAVVASCCTQQSTYGFIHVSISLMKINWMEKSLLHLKKKKKSAELVFFLW